MNKWNCVSPPEPVMLDGSNSWFIATEEDVVRLETGDIHPSAPLWGEGSSQIGNDAPDLIEFERECVKNYRAISEYLESKGLRYQRRSARLLPREFEWKVKDNDLHISMILGKGQYATSLLREVVELTS